MSAIPSAVAIAFPSAAAGHTGNSPYDQDRASVNLATRTIAICDGHGDYGTLAAETAATTFHAAPADAPLPALFAAAETAVRDAMRAAVLGAGKPLREVDGALYRPALYGSSSSTGPIYRGGTTASVLRVAPDGSLTVANVGDSDVVVFDAPSVTHGVAGHSDAGRTLIADHTPTSQTEWERVHAAHPSTRFRFNNPASPWAADRPVWVPKADAWTLNPTGGFMYTDVRNTWGAYVTAADGSESMAMTRALGDFHLKRHGLIAEPEIQTAPAPAPGTTRAVALGSDGLWDALQFEEARDLLFRADLVGNADAATAALLELGRAKAVAAFGPVTDNIICAVVYITVPPSPPAEAEEPPAEPAPDQHTLDCPLHGPMVRNPNGLWYSPLAEQGARMPAAPQLAYSMNERGEYGLNAPPCNGCARGAAEQARVGARWTLEDAISAVRRDPTDTNKEALRAAVASMGEWADYYDYLVAAARALLDA